MEELLEGFKGFSVSCYWSLQRNVLSLNCKKNIVGNFLGANLVSRKPM